MSDDDLPVLVTTKEAAVLLHIEPSAVRVRVHRGDLQPQARTSDGTLLFALTDIFDAPRNRRMRDSAAHTM